MPTCDRARLAMAALLCGSAFVAPSVPKAAPEKTQVLTAGAVVRGGLDVSSTQVPDCCWQPCQHRRMLVACLTSVSRCLSWPCPSSP